MATEETIGKSSTLEALRRVLSDGGLKPEELDGGGGYVMGLSDELYVGAIAHLLEDTKQFVFYVDFRMMVPEHRFPQVAEYLTRANFEILIGNFELDYDDGGVRYRTSLDYEDVELSYELIRNMIASARRSTELYGPPLIKVISGEKSAVEAIEEVEEE